MKALYRKVRIFMIWNKIAQGELTLKIKFVG